VARAGYVDDSSTITVAEYARQFYDSQHYKPTTRGGKATFIRQRLEADPLGAMLVRKVGKNDIRAWVARQANTSGTDGRSRGQSGLSPLTLQIQTGYLRSLFRAAMDEDPPLRWNNPVPPARVLSLPKVDRPRYVPLTVAQVQELAGEVAPHYRALILTQAGLGLRLGEVIALRVEDVDFLRRTVHIGAQLELHTLRRVPPKYNSWRDVPLPGWLAAELSAHMQQHQITSGLLFRVDSRRSNGRALADKDALDHSVVCKQIRKAVARCGLPADTSSHDLRHHYASVLIAEGQSVHAVAEMLGHTDAKKVLDTYGHLMPGSEHSIRKAVERAWTEPASEDREAR
jgi:integrase